MSEFSIKVSKIREVKNHPDADRLDIAGIEDNTYQFVTGRDEFKVGDEVIYFPIDSLLPDELSIYLNVKNFLAGKEKKRIKTVKLRGVISQGLCIKAIKIYEYLQIKGINIYENIIDLKEILGIEKYEPPMILEKGANLKPLIDGVESYDIEGCDNYPDVLKYLMDKAVYISEKIEGSNWGCSITPEGNVIINQRNYTIEPVEGKSHSWIKTSEVCGITEFVRRLQQDKYSGKQITVRAEIIGPSIQANIYKLKEHTLKIFDIKVDGRYLKCDDYFNILSEYDMTKYTVPVIARNVILKDWLNGQTVQEVSNGKSILNPDILREGIVIKPMEEEYYCQGKFQGRLIIKMRSPEYLASEK